MDQQLTQLIIKWVDKAGGAIETGLDFAIQQAPEIFQQYLTIKSIDAIYYTSICAVWFLISIVFILLGIFKKMDDDGFGKWITFIIGIAMMGFSVGIGFSNLADYFKIKQAPKAYMIMKIADYQACTKTQGTNQCHL